MANFITKLFKKNVEKKFYTASSLGGAAWGRPRMLTPIRAMEYYSTVAPLFSAIHMTSSEVGSLDLCLRNVESGELEFNSEILDLLKFPNADCTQYEFMVQLSTFYKLTGNAFIVATGPVNRPASELYVINPTNVVLNLGSDGLLDSVQIMVNGKVEDEFHRTDVDGRFRYYSSSDSEIWHIKSFNTRYGAGDPWGFSELSPITMELEQYYESSVHNLSLLKRGARPSGAIKVSEILTDDQFQRLQQQLEQFYSGSQNAGRSMILEGGDFVEMSQSNKDMDFASLKKDITATIYTALKIPLPIVSAEYSSYNNMETAKLNFYDNCVLPLAKRLLEELTVFLMHRYQGQDRMELVYDGDKVEALEPRRNQELLKLKDSGALTINEIRRKLGYDDIPGGEVLYIPTNLTPLGQDITPETAAKINTILNNNKSK